MKDEGYIKLQQVVDTSHHVLPNTAARGKDQIRTDIQKLQVGPSMHSHVSFAYLKSCLSLFADKFYFHATHGSFVQYEQMSLNMKGVSLTSLIFYSRAFDEHYTGNNIQIYFCTVGEW